MDIIDEAAEREEELRTKALAFRKPTGPVPCGYCLNCEEPVPAGLRWWNLECRDDWHRIQEVAKSKAGRFYEDE